MNQDAEVVAKAEALMVNLAAARGLQNVLKTNLGPRYERVLLYVNYFQAGSIRLVSSLDCWFADDAPILIVRLHIIS